MEDPKFSPPVVRKRIQTVRVIRNAVAEPAVTATGPVELIPLIAALYQGLDANKEHFLALALNTRNRVIGWHHVSTGSINMSVAHPREIFAPMLRLDAVSIIVCHNHPSDEVTPSKEDEHLTKGLVKAGALLGIPVLDHIIIGPVPETGLPNWLSFRTSGHM